MDRCPAAEQLREVLEGHLSEADRDPLARHGDDCGPLWFACVGLIDMRAQAAMPSALRSDTPRYVSAQPEWPEAVAQTERWAILFGVEGRRFPNRVPAVSLPPPATRLGRQRD
jgi:hypothetical protein